MTYRMQNKYLWDGLDYYAAVKAPGGVYRYLCRCA